MLRAAVCGAAPARRADRLALDRPGHRQATRALRALAEDAQTVVYNSSLLDNGHEALCELVAYVEASSRTFRSPTSPICASLRGRRCVAIFFDGKAVDELHDLERVEITCGSEPEALYLLGWLASRLTVDAARRRRACSTRFGEPHRLRNRARRRAAPDPRALRLPRHARPSSREVDQSQETILLSVTGSSRHGARYRAIKNPGIAALVERAILWGQRRSTSSKTRSPQQARYSRREGANHGRAR